MSQNKIHRWQMNTEETPSVIYWGKRQLKPHALSPLGDRNSHGIEHTKCWSIQDNGQSSLAGRRSGTATVGATGRVLQGWALHGTREFYAQCSPT